MSHHKSRLALASALALAILLSLPYVFPATDLFTLSVPDQSYLGETVAIDLTAPEGSTISLTVTSPSGEEEFLSLEDIGSFTHLYTPSSSGVSSLNKHTY